MGSKKPDRSRKGVSTVVGMVFFLLIMLAALNLVLWEFVQMDAYQQAINQRSTLEWERQNEILEITELSLTGSSALNVSVANKGAVMTHLVDMWVSEYEGTTPESQRVFPISYYVNPGETITNVTVDETFNALHTYRVEVVSERGNVDSYMFYASSEIRLRVDTVVTPKNPIYNTNVTVLIIITNNETKASAVHGLTPNLTITTTGIANAELKSEPSPSSVSFLQSGSSTFFQYIYTVTGNTGDTLNFNGSYVGAPEGNFAVGQVRITHPLGAPGAGFSETGLLTIHFDQNSFQYTHWQNQGPDPAWTVNHEEGGFVWWLTFVNHGIHNITFSKYCILVTEEIERNTSNMNQEHFYIVDPTCNYTTSREWINRPWPWTDYWKYYVATAYTDMSQVIPCNPTGDFQTGGTPTVVKFAASDPGSNYQALRGDWWLDWGYTEDVQAMVYLVLYYEYEGQMYSQTIPFAAIHFS